MVDKDSTIDIVRADLDCAEHQRAIVELLDDYARDIMGGGEPISGDVRERLIPALREHPTTIIFLAYADEKPVGLANCFVGFSTFAARPLVNVHDLAVVAAERGKGIGRRLLRAIEEHAREMGCCKLTLEVFDENGPARSLYESVGFSQMDYGEGAGGALFYSKPIR